MIDEKEVKLKMDKVVDNLVSRFTTIRAGRANPNILNGIMVDYYGVPTSIQSLATISIPEANLGINPTNNGEVIMLTVPELTFDTRKKYVKDASSMAEEAKVAIRNIRQDENNKIKKAEIREDEEKLSLEIIQELTVKYNKIIDEKFKEKEIELTSI